MRLILGYYRLLRNENAPGSPDTAGIVSAHFHDLIAAAVNHARDPRSSTERLGIRAARLKALKADIARHAHTADLTIDAVARRLRISPRYIRKLLAGENTTFSELVLSARLRRAHHILADPRQTDRSICDVAFGVGFGDLSYFNRTFRRRFGATPSDVRNGTMRNDPRRPRETYTASCSG
ncbi:MAG: helix-turn-helix transcriptional regulator [Rhizobiaceae bacterium]|nr:helix-turn-helix transcriptional regulator [Rhizobiaceae bacterium]MCV0405352.1 helix-turn-helix transcriptional regulator [Rhizobiaceae bacterium]